MKLLTKLERNKNFWYLLGISILFFFLRIPSLIEPNWYGDEGIYQTIGMALRDGRLLYSQIWDNKPPLLYITYAIFNGDQFQIRLFSLIVGILTTIAFFKLAKILFQKQKATIISTFIFTLLFATPILEGNIANAENFMLLPIITAGYLIYKYSQNTKYKILNTKYLIPMSAGLLLGIAFLFKIVAVFDLAAFTVFLLIQYFPEKFIPSERGIKMFYKQTIIPLIPLFIGFLAPFLVTAFYFLVRGAFSEFLQAVLSSNVGYVGYGNKFIIPQGFLILKLLILFLFCCCILLKRKKFPKPAIFVFVWLAFSIFNTFFSGRPYVHYTLVSISSICLLLGLSLVRPKQKERLTYLLILFSIVILFIQTFKPNIAKTLRYYPNTISFLSGHKSVNSYQSFFDKKTPRDYALSSYIKSHTTPKENIFIWGDSAQIYALSDKIPSGKYTVAYHINQYKNAIRQTQDSIDKSKPKYIITLPESNPIPFELSDYSSKFVFNDATIYERNF